MIGLYGVNARVKTSPFELICQLVEARGSSPENARDFILGIHHNNSRYIGKDVVRHALSRLGIELQSPLDHPVFELGISSASDKPSELECLPVWSTIPAWPPAEVTGLRPIFPHRVFRSGRTRIPAFADYARRRNRSPTATAHFNHGRVVNQLTHTLSTCIRNGRNKLCSPKLFVTL